MPPPFPAGSLLVPSDTSVTGISAVLSPVDGSVLGVPALGIFCEMGDILPNGTFALGKKQDSPSRITDILIYDPTTLASTSTNAMSALFALGGHTCYAFLPIRGNGSDRFYVASDIVGNGLVDRTVRAVMQDGTPGATTWTVNDPFQLKSMAPTYDNATLYYSDTIDSTIFRHNLLTDTDLGTWLAAALPNDLAGQDLYILPDGTLLRTYLPDSTASPTQWKVQHLAADASILHTYALGADADAGSFIFMALDWSDPTVFWVRTFPVVGGATSVFTKYQISDGSTLVSFTVNTVDGTGQVPLSCPFFVLPGAAPPPPPPPPGGCSDDLPIAASSGGTGCSSNVPTSPLGD